MVASLIVMPLLARAKLQARASRRYEIAMHYYRDHIYPHLVDTLGDPPPIQKVRRQIIPLAQGTVLEIGVGAGANFLHYDPARVSKLYALEPNPGMIRLAQRRRHRTKLNVEFLDLPGENIPMEAGSVDSSSLSWGSHPIRRCNAGRNDWSRCITGCSKAYT